MLGLCMYLNTTDEILCLVELYDLKMQYLFNWLIYYSFIIIQIIISIIILPLAGKQKLSIYSYLILKQNNSIYGQGRWMIYIYLSIIAQLLIAQNQYLLGIIDLFSDKLNNQHMLPQTMEKLHRNNSSTPRKVKSNVMSVQPQIQQNQSRSNLRTQYINTASSSNLYKPNQQTTAIDFQRQRLLTNTSTQRKSSPSNISIPGLRQTFTQRRWETQYPNLASQRIQNQSVKKQMNATETLQSSRERPLLRVKNSELLDYQQKIVKLEDELSDSLTDKLALQLKLSKSNQKADDLQLKLIRLQRDYELELSAKERNNHSITLQNHTQIITRLLLQYDHTKQIIQKLMEDNQFLLKRNEQLAVYESRNQKVAQQLQKFKIIVVQTQNQKISLLKQIDSLSLDLDYERNSKYNLLKRVEGHNKEQLESQNYKMQMMRSQQEIQTLKREIESLKKLKSTQYNDLEDNQIKIKQLRKSNQQMMMILSDKDQTILQLNQELNEMGKKMKEMLRQLSTFSTAFETEKREKMDIIEIFSHYKSRSDIQINKLRQEITGMRVQMLTESPKIYKSEMEATRHPNTIYIQPSGLQETKTRITGGYEQAILGQKPPVPVVTLVRTLAEEKSLNEGGM